MYRSAALQWQTTLLLEPLTHQDQFTLSVYLCKLRIDVNGTHLVLHVDAIANTFSPNEPVTLHIHKKPDFDFQKQPIRENYGLNVCNV